MSEEARAAEPDGIDAADRSLRRLAFGLLLAGEAWLLVMLVVGGARYPGYDHGRQFISELGATGAADGWAVSWLAFLPIGILVGAFCLIAAWTKRLRPLGLIGWLLLALNAYAYANSAWFRCDFECAGTSTTQAMHNLFGLLGYLGAVAGLLLAGLSARSSGARWLAPLGAVCAVLALVGFGGLVGSEWRGAFQRLTEAATAAFMLAWGWAMVRARV